MSDDLIKRLLDWDEYDEGKINDARQEAADRIEQLEREADEMYVLACTVKDGLKAKLAKAMEALREISAEASVPVHTWKNGINFKKMYEGWRKISVQRIDVARTVLAELEEMK